MASVMKFSPIFPVFSVYVMKTDRAIQYPATTGGGNCNHLVLRIQPMNPDPALCRPETLTNFCSNFKESRIVP
jgi:hypothetical protein